MVFAREPESATIPFSSKGSEGFELTPFLPIRLSVSVSLDVQDEEEDEDWLSWGNELDEQNTIDTASPQLVFVQLKPKAVREEEDQQKLAHRYRSNLRLGGYDESVFPVSEDRLFLSCKYSQDVGEVRISQPQWAPSRTTAHPPLMNHHALCLLLFERDPYSPSLSLSLSLCVISTWSSS